MAKEKSITTVSTSELDNMNAEDQKKLFDALIQRLAGTPLALEAEKSLHSTNSTFVSQRVSEIDARITALRGEIEVRNTEIKSLMAEKGSLGLKVNEERTRAVTSCPDCGQGRHADNDKTRACKVYPGFVTAVNAAKEAKMAVPTFSAYLSQAA